MVTTGDLVREDASVPSLSKSYASIPHVLEIPHLIRIRLESFRWFQENGLQELFDELSPIQDFTGNRMELRFARAIAPKDRHEDLEQYVGLVPLEDVKVGRRTLALKGEPLTLETAQACIPKWGEWGEAPRSLPSLPESEPSPSRLAIAPIMRSASLNP